jgi:glycosyltransferase involved in cell wall biosynthesis
MPTKRPKKSLPSPRLRTAFVRSGERDFSGFIVDLDNPGRKFIAEILVDGYPLKTLRADAYVHDFAFDQAGDCCYGFSFVLPPGMVGNCFVIEARLANLGTSIGVPIELAGTSGAAKSHDGPGSLRWLGGLRFSGWIASEQDISTVDVLVDGQLTTKIHACGWTHLGTSADDARAVRAFDFHLPERFADGRVHQVDLLDFKEQEFAGSPLVFVAFANGLERAIAHSDDFRSELPRAALFDRLMPMSFPMSQYEDWKARFPPSSGASPPMHAGVIMMGPGNMEDTIESLNAQTLSTWIAASLPPTADPTGFLPEQATAFLEGDGRDCEFLVFGLTGTSIEATALQRISRAFVRFPSAQVIYGDLEILGENGSIWPLAFPAFDYERMLEQGYCAHFFALRRPSAERSLRAGVSNLYRLFNSVLDDGECRTSDIVHLPGASGTLPWFDTESAEKGLVMAAEAHLRQRGITACVAPANGAHLPAARISRKIGRVRATIIIPTRNRKRPLQQCVESIRGAVDKHAAEIVIVDNDSAAPDALDYLATIDGITARVLRVAGSFNLARLNNLAVEVATTEIVCLMSDDIVASDDEWLDEMLSRIVENDVGAVGALLLWPSGVVQHGGVVLGPGFSAAHAFTDRMSNDSGYGGLLDVAHECSAVTAACLVTRRSDYLLVGGMDEMRFPANFVDVDYCLKLRELGKRIVCTPHARLGINARPACVNRFERELQNLRAKWGDVLNADPYYSPMLSLDSAPFSALAWPVRAMEPRVNGLPLANRIPTVV